MGDGKPPSCPPLGGWKVKGIVKIIRNFDPWKRAVFGTSKVVGRIKAKKWCYCNSLDVNGFHFSCFCRSNRAMLGRSKNYDLDWHNYVLRVSHITSKRLRYITWGAYTLYLTGSHEASANFKWWKWGCERQNDGLFQSRTNETVDMNS